MTPVSSIQQCELAILVLIFGCIGVLAQEPRGRRHSFCPPAPSGVSSLLDSVCQATSTYAVVCDNGNDVEGTLHQDEDIAEEVFHDCAGSWKPCMLFGPLYSSTIGALGNELEHYKGQDGDWRTQDHWANRFAERMRKWYVEYAVATPDLSSLPSVLDTAFTVKREQIFDNYVMNGDVVALSAGENLFIDTSTTPISVRPRREISENKNLYMIVTFWADEGVGEVARYNGGIGLQTYPERRRIIPTDDCKINSCNDPRLVLGDVGVEWWHLSFEHVGDDAIRLALRDDGRGPYLRVDESSKQLVIAHSRDGATVFRVLRFRESLTTQLQGVNLASWFNIESWSAGNFFTGEGYDTTGMHFPDPPATSSSVLAKALGETDFRKHYREHLSTFLNAEEDFKFMSLLGINSVRIPCPLEMFLAVSGEYEVDDVTYDANFMSRCYQDACQVMDEVFDAADKYGVGVILSNFGISGSDVKPGKKDAHLWLQFVQTATTRYHGRRSFLGIDLINEPNMDSDILHDYWIAGYHAVRQYSSKALVLMSDRYWASQFESRKWFPRLSPDFTGIVADSHIYTKKMSNEIQSLDYNAIMEKVERYFSAQLTAFRQQYISVAGEFSCRIEKDMHWSSQEEAVTKLKNYMRILTRITEHIGSGGLYYQWHVQYDANVPFHEWSYMNLANYGFNTVFMSSVPSFSQIDLLALQRGASLSGIQQYHVSCSTAEAVAWVAASVTACCVLGTFALRILSNSAVLTVSVPLLG